MTGAMHKKRPQPFDNEHRLVSLDRSDVEDLRRLLAKLSPLRPVTAGKSDVHADNDSEPLVRRARDALEMRRKRIAIFGPQMFAEPAWEMLLILYLNGGGQRHTQTSLSKLSGGSRSTGMRWIEYLVGQGLIFREEHPTDKRRNFVGLSNKGRELLELYLSETA
jgi:DNA-binding MarR family transcriptional regulator